MAKQKISGIETMTVEEKKEFAEKIQEEKTAKSISLFKSKMGVNFVTAGTFTVIGVVALALLNVNLLFTVPPLLMGMGYFCLSQFLALRRALNKVVGKCSNNKLTYKDYKKLVKSGELEKWAKGEIEQKAEPVANNQNVGNTEQNGGVTLSAEEVAVLKKIINNNGLANIEGFVQTEPTTQTTQTKKPTDTGRNS